MSSIKIGEGISRARCIKIREKVKHNAKGEKRLGEYVIEKNAEGVYELTHSLTEEDQKEMEIVCATRGKHIEHISGYCIACHSRL